MSAIAIFDFDDRSVRSLMIDGEPWFVGKDICACLGIADHHQALSRLDEDEVGSGCNVPTPSGTQPMKIISEPGVYRLVFTSRSEAAERFKRWLAHDVLPAIRRTGRFEAETSAVPALADDEIDGLHRKMMILREARLTFGLRAARKLAHGLALPIQPDTATAGDSIATFTEDALIREIGARLTATDLYDAYRRWCAERNLAPATMTAFGRRVTALGFGKLRTGGRVVYTDVDVAAGNSAAEPDAG